MPERIADRGIDVRFIYMVREPFGRIASQVRHGLYEGWGKSLDDELTDDLIDFTRYAYQLDRYAEVFPRDSMLVIAMEELRSHPAEVLQRACRHLGLDPHHRFEGETMVRNKGDFFQAPKVVASLARWGPTRSIVDALPSGIKRSLREGIGEARSSAR